MIQGNTYIDYNEYCEERRKTVRWETMYPQARNKSGLGILSGEGHPPETCSFVCMCMHA